MAIAGIDSHKDTFAAAVVDDQARRIDTTEVENTPAGFHQLVGWMGRHRCRRVGIEGSGSHGGPAVLALSDTGFTVVEVPPQMTAATRRQQRSAAKTDAIDAVLIARITLRETDLPPIRSNGALEDLRVLVRYRRELLAERNRVANRLHSDLEQLHTGYQQRIGRLTTKRNMDRARRLLTGDPQTRAGVARARVTRLKTTQPTDHRTHHRGLPAFP